jgi:heterodisulfide reductase subunit B
VWQDWTKKMAAAVVTTKAAVGKKDQMELQTGGDMLVEICEGCHMAFDPTAAELDPRLVRQGDWPALASLMQDAHSQGHDVAAAARTLVAEEPLGVGLRG